MVLSISVMIPLSYDNSLMDVYMSSSPIPNDPYFSIISATSLKYCCCLSNLSDISK